MAQEDTIVPKSHRVESPCLTLGHPVKILEVKAILGPYSYSCKQVSERATDPCLKHVTFF